MNRLDPYKHPNGGWPYREKVGERWWTAPDPMLPFSMIAAQILAMRKNNGVESSFAQCAKDLMAFNEKRLGLSEESLKQVNPEVERMEGCAGCGRRRRIK